MKPESSVVFFPCRDIAKTKSYYTQVLGLKLYKDLEDTIWLDCGYGYIAFVQYTDGRPRAQGTCVSFNLPSKEAVDEAYELLKSRNAIGLNQPPQKHPVFPVYSFFFSDPDGYTLECQKTLD